MWYNSREAAIILDGFSIPQRHPSPAGQGRRTATTPIPVRTAGGVALIIPKVSGPRNRKEGYKIVKISKLEWAALLICAVCLAFGAGWFLRGPQTARPVQVETQRVLSESEAAIALPTPAPEPTPDKSGPPADGERININTAGVDELVRLPGIGEKRAQDIVDDRAANGPFRIPEDLTRVSGIGEGVLEGLIDFITVS